MSDKEQLLYWNDKILEYLVNHKKEHSEFKFWLRRKGLKGRLERGQWFQGSDYIFIGFYMPGDSINRTKTIGFAVHFKNNNIWCSIDIAFDGEENQKNVNFYHELKAELRLQEQISNTRFRRRFKGSDILQNLQSFLTEDKPIIDEMISSHQLQNEFFISEEDFQASLMNILKIKDKSLQNMGKAKPSYLCHAKNIILYGPPGTGKTYEIRNKLYPYFTEEQNQLTKEEFLQELVDKYTWWQIIAAALLDLKQARVNDIKNHELTLAKQRNNEVKFFDQTIWGHLQSHTVADCEHVKTQTRIEPLVFFKNEKSIWHVDRETLLNSAPEVEELLKKSKKFNPNPKKDERFRFLTFHQSTTYEDFIEGIKPIMEETESTELKYQIKPGIFKELCKLAEQHQDKEYAIFIDEINRGNIANIFGELITLIEPDKRKGAANAIQVELPYSKQPFSVPSNIYIIGTMNTADRSIEALDTALRRRFTFIETAPKPHLLHNLGEMTFFNLCKKHQKLKWDDKKWIEIEDDLIQLMLSPDSYELNKKDLDNRFRRLNFNEEQSMEVFEETDLQFMDFKAILENMNNRVEALLDKDHCIGHAYFMSIVDSDYPFKEFKSVFYNKIFPLLQEYFYGDLGKMELVIGKDFFENKSSNINFAKSNYAYKSQLQSRERYHLIAEDKITAELFKTAIVNLYQNIHA